jgi:exodeoxyribonuclease VIII
MDASTVMWWMKQSDAARKTFNEPGCTLIDALFQFSEWVTTETSDPEIWGNGATFDNVILSNAYEALGLERPWKYWADRCYRTMKAKYPQIVVEKIGTAHNALDDAKSQALHMSRILAHIKGVTHA